MKKYKTIEAIKAVRTETHRIVWRPLSVRRVFVKFPLSVTIGVELPLEGPFRMKFSVSPRINEGWVAKIQTYIRGQSTKNDSREI